MSDCYRQIIDPNTGIELWVKQDVQDPNRLSQAKSDQGYQDYQDYPLHKSHVVIVYDGPEQLTQWYCQGQRHRMDGPAIIPANGKPRWYIWDVDITQEVDEWMNRLGVRWPWDQLTQVQFNLVFGYQFYNGVHMRSV